jgi:integrase
MACSIEATSPGGRLRFRFRWPLPGEEEPYHHAETTTLHDTPENREKLRHSCEEIGKQIRRASFDYLAWFPNGRKAHLYLHAAAGNRPRPRDAAENVRAYFERWIELQVGKVAHNTLLGYRSHFKKPGGILELLGERPISGIVLDDVEYVRAAMLQQGAQLKTVKNAIGGTLRAFLRDAVKNRLLDRTPFDGYRFPRVVFEGADPYTPEEMDMALDALRTREFRVGRGSGSYQKRTHFAYYVAAFTIGWTGMRPEEVVALQARDFDPRRPGFDVRRAATAGKVGATKTLKAQRAVAVTTETAELVKLLIPLRAKSNDWIFKSPEGARMDQGKLNDAFSDECRRLGIPSRGIYALKDTFCSHYISAPGATWEWLSTQTGVAISTLKRHYAKTTREAERDAEELSRITAAVRTAKRSPSSEAG